MDSDRLHNTFMCISHEFIHPPQNTMVAEVGLVRGLGFIFIRRIEGSRHKHARPA